MTDSRPVQRAVTAELLARYDVPGPRYTSYPTAVEFSEDAMSPELYEEHLREAAKRPDDPLSIYVHLPFCRERCLFCGCHVIITPHHEKAVPYLDLLEREIEMVADRLGERRGISQLHLGGGTPTYFEPAELDRLLSMLFSRFVPRSDAELAVECDPRVTTPEHLDALAAHGFNRISFGVQDFTHSVQEAIGRVQSVDQTQRLMQHARRRGFTGINIDLIYGLPLQTPEGFERTIDTVIGLAPDRVAVYSFAFVPWIRGHMKKLEESDFPGRDEKFGLFALARERFLEAGYEPIGMDHFARPEDELAEARREHRLRRNFQGYTVVPAPDVIGLGISAIGDVRGAYVQNEKKLSRYEELVTAGILPVERGVLLTRDDTIRRHVIHELMCNHFVDPREVSERFGIDFGTYFHDDLERLRSHHDLVTVAADRIEATEVGALFVRNLAMCFDRYWWEKHAASEKPVFSRTV